MGWLKRIFSGSRVPIVVQPPVDPRPAQKRDTRPPVGIVRLAGNGGFSQETVGESFYQPALDTLCGGKCEEGHEHECRAILQPEPDNPHDDQAVAVLVRGRKVAHLARADARKFRVQMANLGSPGDGGECAAIITGGWLRSRKTGATEEGHYGIALDLSWPLRRA